MLMDQVIVNNGETSNFVWVVVGKKNLPFYSFIMIVEIFMTSTQGPETRPGTHTGPHFIQSRGSRLNPILLQHEIDVIPK